MLVKIALFPLIFISKTLSILPPKFLKPLGLSLGLFMRAIGLRTKIVKNNLKLAYGHEKSEREIHEIYKKNYTSTATVFLEILRNFTLSKKQIINELRLERHCKS